MSRDGVPFPPEDVNDLQNLGDLHEQLQLVPTNAMMRINKPWTCTVDVIAFFARPSCDIRTTP